MVSAVRRYLDGKISLYELEDIFDSITPIHGDYYFKNDFLMNLSGTVSLGVIDLSKGHRTEQELREELTSLIN